MQEHFSAPPVSQLDPGSGKTKKAYLWAYRSNDLQASPRIIVFDYQPGRSGSHARGFLGNWRGHLLVDDYAGYSAIAPALLLHCSTSCIHAVESAV